MRNTLLLVVAWFAGSVSASQPLALDDMARLVDLSEPGFSPDGEVIVYTASSANTGADLAQSDLWRVGFDGQGRRRLTDTAEVSEWQPRWSPDGRSIAFLSDAPADGAKDEEATTQVWLMPATGGKPRRLTHHPSGVDDFGWSPDSKRLVLVQFKEDGIGYLDHRRTHLVLLDVASGKSEQLTSGAHDELLPAWSPDGRWIAYVSKRGADPDRHLNFDIYLIEPRIGASERQLTTFPGADLDPYWETRPSWSPDNKRIAYLQGSEDKWIYYAPWQLAVVDVDTGKASLPAPIDRCMSKPQWAPDGKSVYLLIEQSRVTHLSRVELASEMVSELTFGNRFDYDLSVSKGGRIAVLGGGDLRPYDISVLAEKGLRTIADHNEFLAARQLAPVEAIRFTSSDGLEIEGMLVRPVGYQPGTRYPTIVRAHGGPVYQFSHEFMVDWQLYAAKGYAVVAINPRGGSGRGFEFSKAIYADWGNRDARDVLEGIEHVVRMGVADPDRLGIGGWSYGAILTNAIIAQDTRFKAAISGAGASNMYALYGHDQYIREYELELGAPWKNRELYDRASFPFLHADRIKTPTMFQCGEQDLNVPCLGAEQMYQALRSLGVPTRLVVYPGEGHQLVVPSYLRDRMARNLAWYDHYLKQ
ncbi:MAG: S9 family peptidase [Gammaproteobacteria bacterium]|nr:S9 family peptidase [Gammaproteobacteria bacterium]